MIPTSTEFQQFRAAVPDTGLDLLSEPCPLVVQCGWYPLSCRESCPRFTAWRQLRRKAHWPPAQYDQRWIPLGGEFPATALDWAQDTWDTVPVTVLGGPQRHLLLTTFLELWAGYWIRRGMPLTVQTVEWPDPAGSNPVTCRIWLLPPGIAPPRVPAGADHTVVVCDTVTHWTGASADLFHGDLTEFIWTRRFWGQEYFQRRWVPEVADWPLPPLTLPSHQPIKERVSHDV